MSNLSTEWIKHLKSSDDRQDFESLVRNSTQVLGRLRDILHQHLRSIDNSETNPEQFQDPAWSWHAAYNMGQRAVYKDLLRLLEFMDG